MSLPGEAMAATGIRSLADVYADMRKASNMAIAKGYDVVIPYPKSRQMTIKTTFGEADMEFYRRVRAIEIHILDIFPNHRGKGYGTAFLRDIIESADQLTLPVKLVAIPDERADKDRLAAWYRRHGFKSGGDTFFARKVGTPLDTTHAAATSKKEF
jgi:GNAT superfamily N-acetyltransferase